MTERYPLGTCVKVAGGFAFKSGDFSDEGIPVVRISDLKNGILVLDKVARIPESKAGKGKNYCVEAGDILMAMSGATTGKIGLVPERLDGVLLQNQRVGNFKLTDSSKIDKGYLKQFLISPDYLSQVWNTMTGVAQPNISSKQLESFKIPLPPLSEQKRIAEILDRAEALLAKRRAALALLDELTQSIFLDMFGDPVTNPKGWPMRSLGELVKLKSGDFLPAKSMNSEGAFLVFGGNGVNGRHSEYNATESKIVVGRVGVYCGCIHVCPPKSWITDNALFVAEMHKDLGMTYLEHALRRANLNQYASKSGQPLISGSRVYPVDVLLPPVHLQREFDLAIKAKTELCGISERGDAMLNCLFASLQHRAFRGEL